MFSEKRYTWDEMHLTENERGWSHNPYFSQQKVIQSLRERASNSEASQTDVTVWLPTTEAVSTTKQSLNLLPIPTPLAVDTVRAEDLRDVRDKVREEDGIRELHVAPVSCGKTPRGGALFSRTKKAGTLLTLFGFAPEHFERQRSGLLRSLEWPQACSVPFQFECSNLVFPAEAFNPVEEQSVVFS